MFTPASYTLLTVIVFIVKSKSKFQHRRRHCFVISLGLSSVEKGRGRKRKQNFLTSWFLKRNWRAFLLLIIYERYILEILIVFPNVFHVGIHIPFSCVLDFIDKFATWLQLLPVVFSRSRAAAWLPTAAGRKNTYCRERERKVFKAKRRVWKGTNELSRVAWSCNHTDTLRIKISWCPEEILVFEETVGCCLPCCNISRHLTASRLRI